MRLINSMTIVTFLFSSTLFAIDFTKISDICEPTDTQSCPNKPNEVKALQEALNANPNLYLYIRADGKWSKGTKEAVKIFQEHYGIKPATGYVGRYTKQILQRVTHSNKTVAGTTPKKPVIQKAKPKPKAKKKVQLPNATPTREFVLYGDMCDNSIKGNNCPNNIIEVSNLQILLNADPNLNVNITADGKWGPGTQKAVIEFQKTYGIKPAEGYVGLKTKKMLDRVAGAMLAKAAIPATQSAPKKSSVSKMRPISSWQDICETTATDKCSNRPEDVRSLQSFLNKAIGANLTVDGKWGRGTKEAVIRFQKKKGIKPANGYVGPKTRRVMQKASKNLSLNTKPKSTHTATHPIKSYADFKKYTNYPKTYKVFKDYKLLGKANGSNTQVKIDISEQRMKLYVNGKVAIDSPCTTGSKHKLEPNTKTIRDKSTPKGTFKITEKIAQKRSTIFGDIYINGKKVYHGDRRKYKGSWKNAKFVGAALHDWMRLTDSGIGMHGSKYIKRYPSSNGCIRLPFTVARTVFAKVKPGTKVKIVN